jgi:hypothetical protein
MSPDDLLAGFPAPAAAVNERGQELFLPDGTQLTRPPRAVTAITLGAGARGHVYGNFALAYPSHLRIVGVAERSDARRDAYGAAHAIPEAQRFARWEDVFERPRFADAVIVSTPDDLHAAPCLAALAAGYDVLLEKPIAPTEAECRALLAAASATDRIVAVCHVLRYAPYFMRMRALIREGAIGELVSLQHMEPIGHTHMAHSYVRGDWQLLADFVQAVAHRDPARLTSTLAQSIESHLVAFACERSGARGTVERVAM